MSYKNLQFMTPEELTTGIEKFSNFAGNSMEQTLEFLGFTNDELNHGDAISFVGEGQNGRQFSFTLDSNNNASTLRVKLLGGNADFRPTKIDVPVDATASTIVWKKVTTLLPPQGLLMDGFFTDIDGIGTSPSVGSTGGLTATSTSAGKIFDLQKWLQANPARLVGMKIVCTDDTQLQVPIIVRRLNPFRREEEQLIYPDQFQDQNVQQTRIVRFPTDMVLDANTEIEYAVVPNATPTIILYFGANLDQGKKLQTMANRAKVVSTSMGGKAVVAKQLGGRI